MKSPSQQFVSFENTLATLQCVLIARRVQASDEPMRLNWTHFDIMAFIKRRGAVVPSAISESLTMSRSSTSKYLKYLDEKGLILRNESGADKRSHQVSLTEQADAIMENIFRGKHENALKAYEALSTAEREAFVTVAAKIAAALDDDSLHVV